MLDAFWSCYSKCIVVKLKQNSRWIFQASYKIPNRLFDEVFPLNV